MKIAVRTTPGKEITLECDTILEHDSRLVLQDKEGIVAVFPAEGWVYFYNSDSLCKTDAVG